MFLNSLLCDKVVFEKIRIWRWGFFFGYKAPFLEDALLEEDTLMEAHGLLEATCLLDANCLLKVKTLLEAKSIGFRISGLLFGALRALGGL